MIENLVGNWLPKKALVLFEEHPDVNIVLLEKMEDRYQLNLMSVKQIEDKEFEGFYVLPMPQLPPIEKPEPKDADNKSE